ncbi:hypothetical protein SLS58_005359 [Diplodia intermedia]|uniref:Cytochrome P450 n=1 Tax=Diplodia intermedia TaxID=856260 RepID=A0ABR3TQR7_9PEZI
MAFVTLLLVPIVTIVLYQLVFRRAPSPPKGLRAVPGPGGKVPLIGHAHLLKPTGSQRQFIEWANQYGELFSLQLGWENWVFLNSPAAVKEIMDKQSASTSGRPPMPVGADIISGDMRFLLMTYSPRWRRLRAIVHKLLTPKASDTFKPSQEFEAKQLLHDILEDPENTYDHCRRYTTSVVMTSTYGRRIPKFDCEDTREIYGLMKDFTENMPPTNGFLPDLVPPLAKLPTWLQWWRKPALAMQKRQTAIWTKYWRTLRQQMETDTAPECFVKQFIETDYRTQDISEIQAAWVAGTMIEAGSETTSSTLNTALKYLAAHPSAQARAAADLRDDTRSPTFADEPALPYIRAIAKEVLRLRPITSFGTPHYTTAGVTYGGYWIPPNTVVAINQYALHHDPARFPDPDAFRPERYLAFPERAGVYAARADAEGRDHWSFGAGRRICSGMHLAENSLFVTLAKVLWAFEIVPRGELDLSDAAFEPGVNTVPKRYVVDFRPRSAAREEVVRREWETAAREGFWLGERRVGVDGVVVG